MQSLIFIANHLGHRLLSSITKYDKVTRCEVLVDKKLQPFSLYYHPRKTYTISNFEFEKFARKRGNSSLSVC